jgi:hypothetical protein
VTNRKKLEFTGEEVKKRPMTPRREYFRMDIAPIPDLRVSNGKN